MLLSITTILIVMLAVVLAWHTFGAERNFNDVATELLSESDLTSEVRRKTTARVAIRVGGERITLDDELGKLGLITDSQRRSYQFWSTVLPLSGLVCGLLFAAAITRTPSGIVGGMVMGLSAGYLASRMLLAQLSKRWNRNLEFFLPIVMERLVMAVQSGLDLMAAITVLVSGDENGKSAHDPVSLLLAVVLALTESGIPFEDALKDVGSRVNCSAISHAFIHLGIAHREGGELVMPLKELSDATQILYQETVEEEIARLPVKATMPLLCTFAGLIMFFVTSPLIQVMTMTTNALRGLK